MVIWPSWCDAAAGAFDENMREDGRLGDADAAVVVVVVDEDDDGECDDDPGTAVAARSFVSPSGFWVVASLSGEGIGGRGGGTPLP